MTMLDRIWLPQFGRNVAMAVDDEHQKVSKVAIQSKAHSLADLMKAMPWSRCRKGGE